jgi:CheY-like chemotaxis protein
VLVVDDNDAYVESLSLLVEMLGHEVRTAPDGGAALDVAAEFRPDVVLMDIGMPGMNGYETARRMREESWGADVMLVALTGWSQEKHRRRTAEAGFDHHLVKPAKAEELRLLLVGGNRETPDSFDS